MILSLLLATPVLAEQPAKPAPAPKAAPVTGCPSLANYRILRRSHPDEAAALALLSDPKADHLGCIAISRERVVALSEHLLLGGEAYDCLALQGTAICHWTRAGTAVPAAKAPPRAGASEKAKR